MRKFHVCRVIALLTSLTAGAAWALVARAEAPQGSAPGSVGALEEIIVTSQRREERLQDVPISVTAFSQERLDRQGLRIVDDVAAISPGVSFQRIGLTAQSNYNDQNSDIAIRGIDSNAGTSTTAIYVDDTPIQTRHIGFGTVTAFPVLFDLDRVEVLRGPQGTLFGASAEGGAVRFVTPEPSLTGYSAYVRSEIGYTDHGGTSSEAAVAGGGPLVDGTLAFRASASLREDGGWVDRADYRTGAVTDPSANWQRTAAVRLALRYAVSDKLTITPSILYQHLYLNDTSAYWPLLSDPDSGRLLNGNAQRNPSTDPFWLAAAKLDWDLGSVRLTANASYFSRRQHDEPDYTQFDRANFGLSPFAAYGHTGVSPFEDNQDNTTAEVRLQSANTASVVTWTAGLYYAHLNENSTQYIYDQTLNAELGDTLCTIAAPCPNGQIFANPVARVIDKDLAVFGEVNVKLGGGWSATAGVRVERASFDGTSLIYGPFLGPTFGPTTPITGASSATSTPVTPRAVLSYNPDRDLLLYASAAKGYREGGINAGLGSTCYPGASNYGVTPSFREDSLWSYELGAKLTLLDHRLQVNTSIFHIDWKDLQQNIYLLSCGQQFVANLGAAKSDGGDIEVQYRPFDPLLLTFSAAYTNARYTETVCGANGCTALTPTPIVSNGDKLPGAPWTVTTTGEYDLPGWADRTPYVRLDYRVTTGQAGLLASQNPANGPADPTIPNVPGYGTLGLRAGLRWSGFDVSAFGQNLTNAHPLLIYSRDTLASPLYFARTIRPMTIGVTATYHY